eukprot:EG_transcript_44285
MVSNGNRVQDGLRGPCNWPNQSYDQPPPHRPMSNPPNQGLRRSREEFPTPLPLHRQWQVKELRTNLGEPHPRVPDQWRVERESKMEHEEPRPLPPIQRRWMEMQERWAAEPPRESPPRAQPRKEAKVGPRDDEGESAEE